MDGGSIEKLIQGAIEEYKVSAGRNVNVGDFVKFVSDYQESTGVEETFINNNPMAVNNYIQAMSISAVALNENKVAIFYHALDSSKIARLYGRICNIDKNSIIMGNEINISVIYTSGHISAVALNENKVVVTCSSYNKTDTRILLLNIQDTDISITTGYILANSVKEYVNFSLSAFNTNTIILTYSSSNSFELSVFDLTGDKINKVSSQAITTYMTQLQFLKALTVTLDENKGFLLYKSASASNTTALNLMARIFTINNSSLKIGNEIFITNLNSPSVDISAVALSENKVVVAWGGSLKGVVCNIDGTTITAGTITKLDTESLAGNAVSMVKLSEDTVLIVHGSYLYASIYKIEGAEFIEQSNLQLVTDDIADYTISTCKLIDNKVFIGYRKSENNYLYAIILDYLDKFVKTVTKHTERIAGIALQEGQAGEIIKISVPNYIKEEN